MTRTAEAGRRQQAGVIQLSGFQADGSPDGGPDGADGALDAVTDTVGAPPAVDSGDPIPPTAGSVVTRSGFGRPRSWVVGIGAGLLALAANLSRRPPAHQRRHRTRHQATVFDGEIELAFSND